ncbi:MAG TPA: cyclic nucleotide-binding domain-containing protein [bacterium]|nr:cyclic nucleotide-binding domain-containing protein [bacterium]
MCAAVLFFGAGLLSFFPKPVLGGFLFFLGLSFLVEWLYDAWFKLPRTDYVLVLLILAAVGAVNFLAGVGMGVVVAIVLFVVNYRLMTYLEKHQVGEGDYLVRQGNPSDAMYFIESGQLTAQVELPDGRITRLRTMRGGTVVGEVPMYIGGVRTASVVALSPSTFYRLSTGKLQEMEHDAPDLAAALHKFIARLPAERLAGLNRTLEAALG